MTKLPIVIIASPRTGSTAYALELSSKTKLKLFQEPSLNSEGFERFKTYANTNQNYIVKILTYQLKNQEFYSQLIDSDCYKIKLVRENKIEQILSLYLANTTGIWNSTDIPARGDNYKAFIDKNLIKICIGTINSHNNIFNDLNIVFDEELTYEQIFDSIKDSHVLKLLPPANFIELKTAIIEEYAQYR